jgi:hypothetical protein
MYLVQTCVHVYKYIHVLTDMNTCTYHIHTCTYMSTTYFLFTYMYVKVCTADVLCTGGYNIHEIYRKFGTVVYVH